MKLLFVLILSISLPISALAEEPKTKCSEAGFHHAWSLYYEGIASSFLAWSYPEQCDNCDLIRNPLMRYKYAFPNKDNSSIDWDSIPFTD